MSNAAVRTAWEEKVFANINLGRNSFNYDFWPETRKERYEGTVKDLTVDFWLYQVRSVPRMELIGGLVTVYEVEVVRVIEKDETGSNYNTVIDDLNVTLFGLVKSSLGDTWNGTVQLWRPPTEAPKPERKQFAEHDIWEARVIYEGEAITNY